MNNGKDEIDENGKIERNDVIESREMVEGRDRKCKKRI